MRTLTLKDHVRYGGKDGVSIEKHSTKIYEDQNGFIFYLRRDLDLSPPCFRIFGPITKDFCGIVPDVKINGEIFFGEGLSWKKAEVIFFDVRIGDTIWYEGDFKTINKNNLSYQKDTDYHTRSSITHTAIDGDLFMLGIKPVELVLFPRYCEGKFIGYVSQP